MTGSEIMNYLQTSGAETSVLSLTGRSAEEVEGRGLVRFDPLASVCSKDGGTTYTKTISTLYII
jgi:hypothetical protein